MTLVLLLNLSTAAFDISSEIEFNTYEEIEVHVDM